MVGVGRVESGHVGWWWWWYSCGGDGRGRDKGVGNGWRAQIMRDAGSTHEEMDGFRNKPR